MSLTLNYVYVLREHHTYKFLIKTGDAFLIFNNLLNMLNTHKHVENTKWKTNIICAFYDQF